MALIDLEDGDIDVLHRFWLERSGKVMSRAQFVENMHGLERIGLLSVTLEGREIVVWNELHGTRRRIPRRFPLVEPA